MYDNINELTHRCLNINEYVEDTKIYKWLRVKGDTMLKNDEFVRRDDVICCIEEWFKIIGCNPDILIDRIKTLDGVIPYNYVDVLLDDIEYLRTTTRINWDGCCPDPEYPEIETVDISKEKLIALIKKHLFKDEEASKVIFGEIDYSKNITKEPKVLNQPCLSTENNNIMVNY